MKKLFCTSICMVLLISVSIACNKTVVTSGDTLTPIEKESLSFMREEEKLAFDVYQRMYDKWGLMPFGNIRQSEARHMAAIKTLLDKYQLPDPSAGKAAGEFENTVIAGLYTSLIRSGDSSEVQALLAGAAIEEIDIRDLQDLLLKTNREDIRTVFEELMRGSRNHLRAFVSNLAARGITYTPRYLSEAAFNEIINSPMERGSGNRPGH